MKKIKLNREIVFSLFIFLLTIVMLVVPDLYESPFGRNVERARARVLSVDNSALEYYGVVTAGSQSMEVEILNTDYKGQIVTATNLLLGKMETDKLFMEGDLVFLVLDRIEDGQVINATAYDHYRIHVEIILLVFFAILLIAFARWRGVRSLLAFAFTVIIIWKLLLPGILIGKDPVPVAFIVVTIITAVTIFLVAGINKTAIVAFLGSFLGILLTLILSLVLMPYFKLHGAVQPFSETLLFMGFEILNLSRLYIAAVFIGASGAVLDVAIDVATAMNEVVEKRPDLNFKELVASGFAVGRNMTSTMVTTLLMAYVSGYLSLLMVFMAQGVPPIYMVNTNYVASEILKTIVGSFGLVTVAPFTALLGGFIFLKKSEGNMSEKFVVYKIEASRTGVKIGDSVQPGVFIGDDYQTGKEVNAEMHGTVQSMQFNGSEHSMEVVIKYDDALDSNGSEQNFDDLSEDVSGIAELDADSTERDNENGDVMHDQE
ncbi:MAG TPA: hypothetical protein DCK95_09185 [Anaerolineaceae bacterium]|uniref:YibE/F family protein n=1 Tax=Anaerolinea thermophila TaxID=167964 RepID=A0A117LH19_9CHLR|nr:MAG: YibE/F family protein [Anaerolinea thermophila]HAF62485.1 hypothetical protein [Anaerolineaceae bacterium]